MGLDHLPPNHWARGRTRGNYAIASVLLAFAAGTYYHTMWRVQSTSELDVAIAAHEAKRAQETRSGK
jgi:hypothetical protein